MDAFIRRILEQMPLSELESIVEEKKKMLAPAIMTPDDEIKAYLLKNVLKYKNPKINNKN
ncbi:hypothetical protein EGI16_03640 [Chryseobacterium sp. G0240]|uniref:hypothetical protein n=1 Tax=Chryseobacterium sp. G0240 TaxID=2487066 RepID=UPI000F454345|nr:hypothetical protein [Chryseobacterium sp. G0240]ROI05490.1 hypothetical protein EGI16_03640 [Chryseobacterium sp. G0240]